MNFNLPQSTVSLVARIFEGYPQIESVVIYGSRAKGNSTKGSDVDLTIRGRNLDLKVLNSISIDLEELNLPYMFDLSIFSEIDNDELISHINRVGEVFYQRGGPGS